VNAIDTRIPSNRPVIRKAERRKSKLRLAICGPTGSGKTMSALLLAFGLGAGKVGLIDTEHGSGDLYAHLGDYDVITLEPPYTVAKYRDAIRAFEDAGYDTIIVDSLSHAWSGEGGLLDKQGQLENSGKYRNSFATWREITPEHNRLVEQMLGSPAHIVATMRSKMEYVVERDDRGKNSVRKIGLSPVQRDGVEYEFTVVMDVSENHTARASKDRTTLFDGWCDRISAATGRTLRQWLDSGTEPARAMPASMAPAPVVRGEEWPDGPIPELDDFGAPPSPETAPRSMRDEINAAVPLRQPKPTVAAWLDQLAGKLELCADRAEVEAAILSDEVCKAGRTLKGAARQALRDVLDAALTRHGEPGQA
jgi:AAA domain